jgi:hypothetical protein
VPQAQQRAREILQLLGSLLHSERWLAGNMQPSPPTNFR